MIVLALGLVPGPLAAQADERGEALTAVLDHVLTTIPTEVPRSRIVLDTLRTATDAPNHAEVATRVARELGLMPGVSEDHCRRINIDHWSSPVGVEVRGVEAIAQASFETFTRDSAYVRVRLFSGSGRYLSGGSSYSLRRDSGGWQVKQHLVASHGRCQPRLFPSPIALALRTMVEELDAGGPICLDATGFPLSELELVAEILGSEIRGTYIPPPRRAVPWPPETHANPCEKADTRWGSVLRVVNVEWDSDELIHVSLEGRRVGAGQPPVVATRHVRYSLRKTDDEWKVSVRAVDDEAKP